MNDIIRTYNLIVRFSKFIFNIKTYKSLKGFSLN